MGERKQKGSKQDEERKEGRKKIFTRKAVSYTLNKGTKSKTGRGERREGRRGSRTKRERREKNIHP
jgi:hypothetical protein